MKKKILIGIAFILAIIGCFCGLYFQNNDLNQKIEEAEKAVINEVNKEVVITEEAQTMIDTTQEATDEGIDISTQEILSEEVLDEEELEVDAQVEQEDVSYDGTNSGNGLSLLGAYQGITYYNQADSRWANHMYSSIGDRSQTMASSACGPTSAAMVVSSSKGAILPTTMAELSVANGYRTANNGTAWDYFPFVADYFGFNEYNTTYNFDTAMSYLRQKKSDGSSKYFIVVSCNSGLWTSGGHYIVLMADTNGTITVYDPYLYSGKFNTASRRAAGVTVSGNSAYVSEWAFNTYSNAQHYWIFSNDHGSGNNNANNNSNATNVNYVRYVSTQSLNLNVRSGPNGVIIGSLKKGTSVNVDKTSGNWSHITSPMNGWVSTSYLSSGPVYNNQTSNYKYTTGTYKVKASVLNVRTGPGTGAENRVKKYYELTANARSQNSRLGNYYTNGYKRGVICTVTRVSGNWGLTASGWICLDYCTKY